MPASVKEAMKYGPPRSLKLREQMVSATHNVAPSMYTLHAGVSSSQFSRARPELCRSHSSHSLSHAAVRGALAGASRNSVCQPSQVVSYVNIVKRSCETYGKLKRSCVRQESLQRAAGAHSVACEKRGMRSLCPDEIVASVVGWSNDYIMCGQRFERVFENGTRQVWAVAVECDDAPLMTFCEMRKHRNEACGKTFTFLRNYARCSCLPSVPARLRPRPGT